jgi:hypothetical protein
MENTKAQKVKMYDMEMEFEIDLKDKRLDNAMSMFKMPTPYIENATQIVVNVQLPTIPTDKQIKEMEEILLGKDLNDFIICGARFTGYKHLKEIEVEIKK